MWLSMSMPWEAVLGHLEVRDLCNVSATCRRLRTVSHSPSLWRRLVEELEPSLLHEDEVAEEGWRRRFVRLHSEMNLAGRRMIVEGTQDGEDEEDSYSYRMFITHDCEHGLVVGHGSFGHGDRFQVRGRRRGRALWFAQTYHASGMGSRSAIAVSAILSLHGAFLSLRGSWTNSDGLSGVFQAWSHDTPPAIRNAAFQTLIQQPLPPLAPRGATLLKPMFPYPLYCEGDTALANYIGLVGPQCDVRGFHAIQYTVEPDATTPQFLIFDEIGGLQVTGVWGDLVTIVRFAQVSNQVCLMWGTRTPDGLASGMCDEYDAPPESDDLEFQRCIEKWTLRHLPEPKE